MRKKSKCRKYRFLPIGWKIFCSRLLKFCAQLVNWNQLNIFSSCEKLPKLTVLKLLAGQNFRIAIFATLGCNISRSAHPSTKLTTVGCCKCPVRKCPKTWDFCKHEQKFSRWNRGTFANIMVSLIQTKLLISNFAFPFIFQLIWVDLGLQRKNMTFKWIFLALLRAFDWWVKRQPKIG